MIKSTKHIYAIKCNKSLADRYYGSGLDQNSLPRRAQHLIWLGGRQDVERLTYRYYIVNPPTTYPFHIYVPTNPLMARAIKPLLLLDCPVDPIIFFRYKDHSPSYRLCTLFVSSSNHRGLDWKSVDTDADVARPRNYAQ